MRSRKTDIILAIAWVIIVMVGYPYVKPVVEEIVLLVITETTPTAFEEFILDTMPLWGLAVAFIGVVFIAMKGARNG